METAFKDSSEIMNWVEGFLVFVFKLYFIKTLVQQL